MTAVEPVISVCIANYNGKGLTDACLQSVMNQQGDLAVEILVHDDASTDGSIDDIRRNYPAVRLLASQQNVGFCVANNRMAAEARGKYLLLLNNDATLHPDALQTLIAEATRLARPAILGLPQFDATTGKLVDRGCLLDPFFNPVPNLDQGRQDVAMMIGACLWIPVSLWRKLGGFPEWFGSIAEDMYLCGSARLAGYAVRVLDRSGYRHWQGRSFGGNRINSGRLSTTYRRRALSERNKTYVMVMLTPAPLLGFLMPLHLLALHAEGLLVTLLKRDLDVWRTIYAPIIPGLWRNRTQLLSLRKEVQRRKDICLMTWLKGFVPLPHKIRMLLRHGMPDIL